MEKKYSGVFIVLSTPFDERGEVDEAALRRHIRYMIDECEVHGIIPCGSTGEFAYLSEAERRRVVEVTIDEVNHKLPVIAGTAACSTREVIHNCATVRRLGADGVMIVPSYYGGLSQEELYVHFADIAQSTDLPIVLYNNTGTTHSDILPETVARLAEFDNIVAIKESTGVMQRVAEIMRRCGDRIEVLCGCDTLALEMFVMGVEGWIAAPANVAARQCVKLYRLAVEQKDFARAKEYYLKILPLFDLFEASGKYVQLAKAGLELLGRSIGKPRPPMLPPSEELQEKLKEILLVIQDV
ncbi:MAG: 4-hydroxy-tetrahydrodipicolinate synthase [Chloroflexi bacterium]|nr:4-hydroxy-tetrahydrodipicolinate synthase [Chloroflexota bacterium]